MNLTLFMSCIGVFYLVVGYIIWKKNPEKSAALTSAGIWLVFTIGLTFTLLLPSFNNNWSYASADNLSHYHVQYPDPKHAGGVWGYTASQERGTSGGVPQVTQGRGCSERQHDQPADLA